MDARSSRNAAPTPSSINYLQRGALYSAVTEYVRTEMNRVQRFTETTERSAITWASLCRFCNAAWHHPRSDLSVIETKTGETGNELAEARLAAKGRKATFGESSISEDILGNLEEFGSRRGR